MIATPQLHTKGFYEFKAPWASTPEVVYECIAIRTFEDIYKLGLDVYDVYYKPVGLYTGKPLTNGELFDFNAEAGKSPNIITLKGSDGSMVYIPDTFISKLPDTSLVPYSEVVVLSSLGMLPDELDLNWLLDDIKALIAARMNINMDGQVHLGRVAVSKNPTADEHVALERTRKGSPPQVRPNTQMLLDEARKKVDELMAHNKFLTDLLIDSGHINQLPSI